MSKEFEEIVLKKLEALEDKTSNTDKTMQEVVLKKLEALEDKTSNTDKTMQEVVLKKLEALEDKTSNTDKTMQEIVLKKLEGLETEVKNTQAGLNNLSVNTEQRLGKLEMEVKDMGEVVNYLNQNFIRFDYEINKKIDTLFDAYSVNQQNDKVHEENIVSLNTQVFNHDIRISNLENTVLTT